VLASKQAKQSRRTSVSTEAQPQAAPQASGVFVPAEALSFARGSGDGAPPVLEALLCRSAASGGAALVTTGSRGAGLGLAPAATGASSSVVSPGARAEEVPLANYVALANLLAAGLQAPGARLT
jgi:hypothetical protein